MYRAKGLAFCKLDDSTIVLEPSAGMYYLLSERLAEFLLSLSEAEPNMVSCQSEYLRQERPALTKEMKFLLDLYDARLIILTLESIKSISCQVDTTTFFNEHLRYETVKKWGSVVELTQTTGTSAPGGPIT
jgi:hypothetical protein